MPWNAFHRISKPLFCVLTCLLTTTAPAEETTLSQLLLEAAENNAELKASYYRWQAAQTAVKPSNQLPNPQITYANYLKSVETRVGPQKHRVSVRQMVPWLGKLHQKKQLAMQEALVEEQRSKLLKLKLFRDLKHLVFDHYFIDRTIKIKEENLLLLDVLELTAQSAARVGGSISDVIQAQIEVSKLHDDIQSVRKRLKVQETRLNAILHRPVETLFSIPTDIANFTNATESAYNIEGSLESNPEIRVLELRNSVKQASKQLAHQKRFPDITLGVDWIQTDSAVMSTPDSGKDPIIASVAISVPLWQTDYKASEDSAASQADAAGQDLDQKRFTIASEHQAVLLQIEDAEWQIQLYQNDLKPQAEQTFNILQEAYETGKADYERFLGIQKMLLELNLSLERSRVMKAKSIATLEWLRGQ